MTNIARLRAFIQSFTQLVEQAGQDEKRIFRMVRDSYLNSSGTMIGYLMSSLNPTRNGISSICCIVILWNVSLW